MLLEIYKTPIIESLIEPLGYNIIPFHLRPYCLAWYDAKKLSPYNPPIDNTWYDYSGNGRNMTMYNLAYTSLSTLTSVNGFECDGVDDYGVIADSAATRLTTGGTLMAWIYSKGLGENDAGRIIDKSTAATADNGYSFLVNPGPVLYAQINAGPTLTSTAITLNMWQHAVMTFDGTGRKFYVNGVDVTASGGSETALPPNVAGVVTIGNRSGATDRTFGGNIDKPAIFNRVLSQAEIQQIFNAGRRRYGI